MDPKLLIGGYWAILDTIYSPKCYYQRVIRLFREYRPLQLGKFRVQKGYVGAFFKSVLFLGVLGKERLYFWWLIFWCLFKKPRLFPQAITYAVYGYHFRKVAEKIRGDGKCDSDDTWLEESRPKLGH
jgi:hypothetical protein